MAESLIQDHIRPGDKPVCDLCDTKIDHQLSKCLACNVYMCRICTTAHQRVSATKQHNIVARIERIPSKSQNVSQMCKTHKDEEIAFYCYSCTDFICSECILGDHNGHDGVKFKDFANQKRREMNVKLNQAREAKKSEITKLTKQIEEKEKENDDNDKDTENQIQDRKTQIIAEVDKIINGLKEEKTKIHKQNKDKLEAVKAQVTQGSPEFNKLCSEYDELLCTGSDMEVVMSETEMYQNLDSVPFVDTVVDIDINKSRVVSGQLDKETLVLRCGYIESYLGESTHRSQSDHGSLFNSQSHAESLSVVTCYPPSHSSKTLCIPQHEVDKFSDLSNDELVISTFSNKKELVISICPLSDDIAIIQYLNLYDNDVVIMSIDGQIKKTLKFDFLADNFIMTSLVTNHHYINLHRKELKHKPSVQSPLRPVRLCEASDGNLLVSLIEKPSYKVNKSSRRLVSKITMGGTTRESYEYHNRSRLFTWPQGVSENINKDICVIELGETSGRLVVIDKTGKLKYTYEGQKLRQPFDPFYVKCDKSGHVIVNDSHNIKVHMLDMDGLFIRYIAETIILKDNPRFLELDKNDILWIGCEKGNLYKLKYLK
ncbi:LOW QUALITY PROTEIN: hypothetical protein KUTeg_023017 [Tegillarca granosa]|uniref:B box-type domain-containing protein n=1 Tax=Tegillarca granosa TaxID=220873 RepID=A0ABQ9E122_TEGGR|nr:LOW QUALITY PROTEIN: hypothetical protein KUTeg_023017 [Tegillarca granosa]